MGVMQRGDYGGAAQLAFQMRQPGRLLAVVDSALASGHRSKGAAILDSLASAFPSDRPLLTASLTPTHVQ